MKDLIHFFETASLPQLLGGIILIAIFIRIIIEIITGKE